MHFASCLRVELTIQRKAEKSTLNRRERQGLKKRDILKRYSADKATKLMASLKSRGLWYFDPEFDGDEEACSETTKQLQNCFAICFAVNMKLLISNEMQRRILYMRVAMSFQFHRLFHKTTHH